MQYGQIRGLHLRRRRKDSEPYVRYVWSFGNNGEDYPRRFVPRADYARELKRYGVLPADWDLASPLDPYETDRKYWESLQYRVPR